MIGFTRLVECALVAAALCCAPVSYAAPKGPYEVKSGTVETSSSTFGNTTTVEYFDDYGTRNARYTTSSMMGQTSHKLEIHLPDGTSYDINLDAKTGTKMRITPEQAEAIAKGIAPQMAQNAKISNLPAKEFLGKKCDGKQMESMGMTARVWTWKGIMLYSETQMGPMPLTIRATKVSEGSIPAAKFAVPSDVKIQNLN